MKKYFLFTLLILIITGSFLFTEKPDTIETGSTYQINDYLSISINSDSWQFLESAKNPSRLFRKNYSRQSRPLYVFIGTVLGYPVNYVISSICDLLKIEYNVDLISKVFYFVFVFINFLICLFMLILFDKTATFIFSNSKSDFLILIFCTLLISNNLIKVFFWSPHQQLFNLFTPILSIYLMILIALNKVENKTIYLVSFLVGLGLLIYGNFLLVLPCIFLALFFRSQFKFSFSLLKNAIISGVLFIIPNLIWIIVVTIISGKYYNHAIAHYRQLIWVKDTLDQSFSDFQNTFNIFTNNYFSLVGKVLIGYLIIYFAVKILNRFTFNNKRHSIDRTIEMSIISTGLVFFLFFWFLGYYESRLIYCLVPIIMYYIILEINPMLIRFQNPFLKIFILFIVMVYHLHNVSSYWPFF